MNHGMGMMPLGCGVPMAALLVLPSLRVSVGVPAIISIGGMIALHAGMVVIPRLRSRKATKLAAPVGG